jgi:hypothetical protein
MMMTRFFTVFIVLLVLAGCESVQTQPPLPAAAKPQPEHAREKTLEQSAEKRAEKTPEIPAGERDCPESSPGEPQADPQSQPRTEPKFEPQAEPPAGKVLLGAVEYVNFKSPSLRLAARIDTGATTSSLGVLDQQLYERDGSKWVRFSVANAQGKPVVLQRPLLRKVSIKAGKDSSESRWVVSLPIQLGGSQQQAEFSLADRRAYKYSVLIGRNVLMGEFVVDVSQQFVLSSGGEQ